MLDWLTTTSLCLLEVISFMLIHSAWLRPRADTKLLQKGWPWLPLVSHTILCPIVVAVFPTGLTLGKEICFGVIQLVWSWLFWQGGFLPRLAVILFDLSLTNCLDYIVVGLLQLFAGMYFWPLFDDPALLIWVGGISKLLLVGICYLVYRLTRRYREHLQGWRLWANLAMLPLVLLVLTLFIAEYLQETGTLTTHLVLLVILLGGYVLMFVVQFFPAQTVAQAYRQGERQLLAQNKAQRKALHNSKDFDLAVLNLAKAHDVESIIALASQRLQQVGQVPTRLDTGNLLVDTVLSAQQEQARQQGVTMELQVCDLQGLELSEVDTLDVFSNLLNNAREAAAQAPGEKWVVLDLCPDETRGGFSLTVRNSYPPPQAPKTTKKPTEKLAPLHGYGQDIVQEILQKYDRNCNYFTLPNEYCAKAHLPGPKIELTDIHGKDALRQKTAN